MPVEIRLKVGGVELVNDGVIVMLLQEKPQLPLAPPEMTDDARVFKKMAQGLKAIGIQVDPSEFPCGFPRNFRTGMWFTEEDYVQMGKPTVGDVLKFTIGIDNEETAEKT